MAFGTMKMRRGRLENSVKMRINSRMKIRKVKKERRILSSPRISRGKTIDGSSSLMGQELLDGAIEASYTNIVEQCARPMATLRFPPGVRLKRLRGWDRLQAGWESLPLKDRWWTVDLYLNGKEIPFSSDFILDINETLEGFLKEGYSNKGEPSDGQIYRKNCQHILQDDVVAERQWWARLSSKNKRLDLKRLLCHERYTTALGALLEIPGLWEGVRGGMWKKMMDLRCRFWTVQDYVYNFSPD